MRIDIFKTHEIPDDLWPLISKGFNECFNAAVSSDDLKQGFCVSTQSGYSYHAIAFSDDDDLMGYTVFTPTFYEENIKVLVGGATFIRKKYREDFLLFAKIVNALKQRCSEDGFGVVVAVPNSQSIDYAIRINRFEYVADLDYYILPIKPSKVLKKPNLKVFDYIFRPLVKGWVLLNYYFSIFLDFKSEQKQFRLVTDYLFYKKRFQQDCYINFCNGKYSFTYRHYDEDGIDTIYIMDFRENGIRTSNALSYCLKNILKRDNSDAILFVGFLGLKQMSLIKTPKRFVPKPLPFTFHVIDRKNKELIERMKHKTTWDFSLMNFDVR